MIDNYGREINYIRISITDRCNLRCRYCMPEEGFQDLIPHDEILSYEEIVDLARAGAELGISKVRLTGGEPLVRRDILRLVEKLHGIPGIEEIDITTNGVLLEHMAADLKRAGIHRVNISLDTLDEDKYRNITRGGDLQKVLRGIDASLKAGLTPLKINTVALKGFNDDEFGDIIALTKDQPISVRFIELMPIGHNDLGGDYGFISNQEILSRFPELVPEERERFSVAVNYRLPGAKGTVGFISALSNHFCAECNKIRLTSDGKIKPCLHSNEEIDMKQALQTHSHQIVLDALAESVGHKIEHHLLNEGAAPIERNMNKIGG